ncbi:hypothetical protein [Streptomyces sparsogenes]|uniref:Uncharacterized protein n=1 Tax=Streptomyces sparsogenes DSM 40356 TaxID=1331668 RepID=A0A1R1SIR3_9ACTN|nr:hypothetical protein [Streptomyces sparsogenes]OMI38170.1 hypothetical protein SPAR_17410 [Streptomyces sparsogenes DSM 40356]
MFILRCSMAALTRLTSRVRLWTGFPASADDEFGEAEDWPVRHCDDCGRTRLSEASEDGFHTCVFCGSVDVDG